MRGNEGFGSNRYFLINVAQHYFEAMLFCGCMVFFFLLVNTIFVVRLENAVLDLVADDKDGLQKQKTIYHWDKVLETFE